MVVFRVWDQWLCKCLAKLSLRSPLAYMTEVHATNLVSVHAKSFSLNGHISKSQHDSFEGAKASASKQKKSHKNYFLKNKLLLKSHFPGKEQKRWVP